MRRAAVLALLIALALPARGQEAPRVALRVGSHADHGRLVFDWPDRVPYTVEAEEGRVVLRFGAPARLDLAAARRPPRNVLALEEAGEAIVIRSAPGARMRHFRLGNRVVLDLLDPAAGEGAPERAAPPPSRGAERRGRGGVPSPVAPAPAPTAGAPRAPVGPPAAAATPAPTGLAPPAAVPPAAASPAPPAGVPAPPAAAPAPTPARAPAVPRPAAPALVEAVAARPAVVAAASPDAVPVRAVAGAPAIAIAAGAETGLALFRRGDRVLAVFDRAIALDATTLAGQGPFAGIEATAAGDGTVLRLRLPAAQRPVARRDGASWIIEARSDAAPAGAPVLRVVPEAGPPARIALEGGLVAGQAGGIVAIADPETGETLLVATLRQPGPGVVTARRLPEFELLPSAMGAVVLARSDRIALRAPADRILVEAAGGTGLALGGFGGREPPAEAVALSRLLELPVAPVPALMERMRTQLVALNDTPPLGRGEPRRALAETLLALGMPQEAQAMAVLAQREDPRARDDARLLLAQGAAALLAARPEEARGILDPRLPAVDEVTLWRGLLAAAQGDARGAAPLLAAGAPLLFAYPEALRARLLPVALETLAAGGEGPRAARLLAEAGDAPGLELARAMVAEAEGRAPDALAAYDALAQGRDRRARAQALRRAVELRLATGALDAAGAAAALEQALLAWRGGPEEAAARRRVAALRLAAGDGAAAFALLEETARSFPDQAAAIRPELALAFAAALETAPPLAATTLFDAHPDLLPEGEGGEAAVLLLAERLAALDLPGRAAALLERASRRAAPPVRAAIGARLAALRAQEGDAAAVLAVLDATAAEDLPAPLAASRAMLRARALARRGDRVAAEAVLAALGPAGAEARAELRVEAQDWAGAAAAQTEHLAASLPAAPAPLAQADRVALARAAAYAALAGDEAALAALRQAHGARMADGPLAEAFGVLTSDPLRGVADLPRLSRELGMLRLLPGRLEALRGGVQVAR